MDQKLVAIRKDGKTFLLAGDPDAQMPEQAAMAVLPKLLAQRWRIVSIHMTASAAVNDDQVLGLALLQR